MWTSDADWHYRNGIEFLAARPSGGRSQLPGGPGAELETLQMQRDTRQHGWRSAACGAALAALAATGCVSSEPPAPASDDAVEAPAAVPEVRGAHEAFDNPQETFTDERGLHVEGLPVDFPARRYPASADFPTGPALGERLPDFTLANQHGEPIDFHADRDGHAAVVVFYRSAVW